MLVSNSLTELQIGVVEAVDIVVAPSLPELSELCHAAATEARARFDTPEYAQECQEVRLLLRYGKFKATGRSKPAQEYLMRCVVNDGSLPCINAPVDLLNAVSISCNLPISLLSVAKCSTHLSIERGKAGESFVFNAAGQVLDVTDLITVYDQSSTPFRPIGTPVKDSLAGKIEASDSHLVAIIYSPKSEAAIRRCEIAKRKLEEGFAKLRR